MVWREDPRIPGPVRAVLDALRFDGARRPQLADADWQSALAWCDRFQLTLLLGALAPGPLPAWVSERISRCRDNNRERRRRLLACWEEVSQTLDTARVQAVVLKGFAHWQDYTPSPDLRVQYDLDLYTPDDSATAHAALRARGYAPLTGGALLPPDHLPSLRRPTGWQWNGDYFDPEIPLAIEIHHRLWNANAEGLSAPGVEEFWRRRAGWFLHPADGLAYAGLHALRHILRGDTRPAHMFELAWFLENHRADEVFWAGWQAMHGGGLRRLEAVALAIVEAWYGPRLHPVVREEVNRLPAEAREWAARGSSALIAAYFQPNKEEIGLYRAIAGSGLAGARYAMRRLVPLRPSRPAAFAVGPSMPLAERARRHAAFARYCCGRVWYHARAMAAAADAMVSSTRRW